MRDDRYRMLPATTTSEEARRQFEAGCHAAFHYQPAHAKGRLDAAIASDPAFVLAYLHRGGMSLPSERGRFFDLARAIGAQGQFRGEVEGVERSLFRGAHAKQLMMRPVGF